MTTADLFYPAQMTLGEGVTWCARTRSLYWTDILGNTLYRWDSSTQHVTTWAMPEPLACFSTCTDERFLLLGLASQLAWLELESQTITSIHHIEQDLPTRLNDGRCDREGRFVFGTLNQADDQHLLHSQPIAQFYRLNHDLSLEELPLSKVQIANSTAFSPDGRRMYYTDSAQGDIRCCDYAVNGQISNDRIFSYKNSELGDPDGSTVDSEGYLWNARWTGSCVVRYAPDADPNDAPNEFIQLPASQATCVAIGGSAAHPDQLNQLYITSAYGFLSENQRTIEKHAGSVFVSPLAVTGIAETQFKGQMI